MVLDDYQIWKCSDPFTGELEFFTCAAKKHTANTHRLVCDLNRSPDEKAFHDQDYFGNNVFKLGQEFTDSEKKGFIQAFWHPYHNEVEKSVKELDQENPGKILIVDYHNTSGDHPLNTEHEFMPSMVISDLDGTTMPKKEMELMKQEIEKRLPLRVEIDAIYHGGFDIRWFADIPKRHNLQSKLYCLQLEYNLDFIHNPISRQKDRKAKEIMETAINNAIETIYESLPSG